LPVSVSVSLSLLLVRAQSRSAVEPHLSQLLLVLGAP